jgi:zinc protease
VLWNADFDRLGTALERTVAVLDRARRELPSSDELERSKAAVLLTEYLDKQSLSDRASEAALNVLYGMGLEESERFAQRVKAVDAAAVQAAARRYLRSPSAAVLAAKPVDEDAIHRALAPLLEGAAQ